MLPHRSQVPVQKRRFFRLVLRLGSLTRAPSAGSGASCPSHRDRRGAGPAARTPEVCEAEQDTVQVDKDDKESSQEIWELSTL